MVAKDYRQSRGALRSLGVLGMFVATLAAHAQNTPPPKTALDDQPARMLSAFFGLDNAIRAPRARGADGLPVTFTKRVAVPDNKLDPNAFTVVTRAGKRAHPTVVTTRPANEPSKRHTVLLLGEFGNEGEDPPVKVEITSELLLAGGENVQGLSVDVTPLKQGPSMVMAYMVQPEDFHVDVPTNTKQVVVTVWNGGVTPMDGISTEDHRLGYTVKTADGKSVHPIALGDIGGDNYEFLYLDTEEPAIHVSIGNGLLMDPRADANPASSVEVAGESNRSQSNSSHTE
ncbi:MAG: hypothetical protein VCD00_07460 [Candidatus Hydrogenedentota bacterium]